TEYYNGSGNTCKKCAKDAQRIRIAQKRLVEEEGAEDNMEQRLRYNYTRVDAWQFGVQVMKRGVLVGKTGHTWWCDKLVRHKAWLRRKRMKEEVKCR
ncbi:unnamed protein product, partial [marine sediment metagenome]